jgi:hypothetical protein
MILHYGIIFVKVRSNSREGNMRIGRTGTCLAAIGIYTVLRLTAAYIRPAHIPPIALIVMGLLSIAIFMFAQLGVVVSFTGVQMRIRTAGLVFLASLACLVLASLGGRYVVLHRIMALFPVLAVIRDLSLMLAATSVGYTVSFIIKEPGIILPVAICAAFVDFFNVLMGPLGKLVEAHPDVVSKVTVHMPTFIPRLPEAMMGAGDVLFLGIFFGALWRFSMNVKAAFWAGFALLTLSIYLLLLPFVPALPALVPMGLAIILSNWSNFHLKREELLATVYVSAMLLVLLLASVRHMNRLRSIGAPAPTPQEVRTHSHSAAPVR